MSAPAKSAVNRCEGCGRLSGLRWKCAECIGLSHPRVPPPRFSAGYLSPSGEWWIAETGRDCGHNDLAGVIDHRLGLGLPDAQTGLDDRGWLGVMSNGALRCGRPWTTTAQEGAIRRWEAALEDRGNHAALARLRGYQGDPDWLREAAVLLRERSGD